MRHNRVFSGYKEGIITFLPTYKYDNGSDEYDTRYKNIHTHTHARAPILLVLLY